MDYFVADGNGAQTGPFPASQLQNLNPDTLVWAEGMPQWQPAHTVSELRPVYFQPQSTPQPFPLGYANNGMVSGQNMASARYDANKKSLLVAYVLWGFLGMFGAHRFYLGRSGSATAMLVTTICSIPLLVFCFGVLGLVAIGIWKIVDAFLIPSICSEYNNRLIDSLNGGMYAPPMRTY